VTLIDKTNSLERSYEYIGTLDLLLKSNGIRGSTNIEYFTSELRKTNKLAADETVAMINFPLQLNYTRYIIKIACSRICPDVNSFIGEESKEMIYSKLIESNHIIDDLKDQLTRLEQLMNNLLLKNE
jgi:hypothetical protein